MDQIGSQFNPEELVNNIKDGAEKRALNNAQEKEKFKQEIMYEFDDADSSAFWNKCFIKIPLKTIKMLVSNMRSLQTEKYVIRNKPGFFISLLRKQGLFPFADMFIIALINIVHFYILTCT